MEIPDHPRISIKHELVDHSVATGSEGGPTPVISLHFNGLLIGSTNLELTEGYFTPPPQKKNSGRYFRNKKTSANFNLIFFEEKGDEMEASRKIPFLMAESTLPKSADFFLLSPKTASSNP